jgi:hypothetical protein
VLDNSVPYLIYIIYENRTDSNDWNITLSKSIDGGATFQMPYNVNDDPAGPRQANPAIAVDNIGAVAMVWQDFRDGTWDIYGTFSMDNGSTFGINSKVNSSVFDERNPDVAIDIDPVNNTAEFVVIYQTNNNTLPNINHNIYATVSGSGGSTWNDGFRIDDTGAEIPDQIKPRGATDGKGSVYAVWEDFRSGNGDIYFDMNDNTLPIADAGPDQYIDQFESANFLAENSWDNLGIANFTWTFNDGGVMSKYGYCNRHFFSQPGDYLVTLTVTDYHGNQDTDIMWVFVRDRMPPVFTVDSTPATATTGDSFTFTATVTDHNLTYVNVSYWFSTDNASSPTLASLTPTGNQDEYGYTILAVPHTWKNLIYQLSATDATNNIKIELVKVVPVIDDDKPEINLLSETTPTEATTGDPFTFGIDCTDNIKVENAYVEYWFGTGTHENQSLVKSGDTYTFVLTGDIPSDSLDTLYYIFSFEDNSTKAGGTNWAATEEQSVPVIDNDKPTFDADNSDTEAYAGQSFDFSLEFSDNIATQTAKVFYWYGTSTTKSEMALTESSGSYVGSIDIPNALDPLNYNFTFWDTSGNWDVTIPTQVDVLDDEDPMSAEGSGNIQTTTGESFEIFATFTDNVGIDLVKVYFSKESTSSWSNLPVTSTTDKYMMTNDDLDINTSSSIVGWKYYFEASDESLNMITYGTAGNPYIITVTDNDKPLADAGADVQIKTGKKVTFDASGSSDNIGIVKYSWSFEYDDVPKVLQGEKQEFTFEIEGEYEVTLTVWDGADNTDTDTLKVLVSTDVEPPVAVLDSPEDKSTISDTFITLTWHTTHANYQLVTYDLYFGESSDPPLEEEDIELESGKVKVDYTVEDLVDGKTYYWAVKPKLGPTEGLKTEVRSFTIDLTKVEYGVSIDADKTSLQITVGKSESVTLTITNTGSASDVVELSVDEGSFPEDVTLEQDELILTAQQGLDVKLTIETKESTPIDNYTIKVTAKSKSATEDITASVDIKIETIKEPTKLDADNDNLPDLWEIEHFGDIQTHDGDDDPDGDGYTNIQEYNKGSDPLDEDDPDKQDGKDGDGDDNLGMIIGIVVVIIVVVVLLLLFIMMKKKGGKKDEEPKEPEQPQPRAPTPGMMKPTAPTTPTQTPTPPRPGAPGPGTGPTPQPQPQPGPGTGPQPQPQPQQPPK